MNITVVCIGKLKEKYWVSAIEEYSKRLSRYCTLLIDELKEEKLPDNASAAEGRSGESGRRKEHPQENQERSLCHHPRNQRGPTKL